MKWFLFILCLAASFVFSGTETGLLSLNRLRLRQWSRSGDAAAIRLWREAAFRVLPGGFMTRDLPGQPNHGNPFIRIALVHPPELTAAGLARLADTL